MNAISARQRRKRLTQDSGYATAETAVALPSMLLVLAMAVWVLACVSAQLRCVDAARTAARSAARGDADLIAVAAGRRVAPSAAQVRLTKSRADVQVEVSVSLRPFGHALRILPPVRVSARASAEREDRPAGIGAG